MALRLRIISDHRRTLGERSTVTFGVEGGTIGRSADNDWVLPDPQRYISAHHARVSFQGGEYLLEDTSTNGVFVNDDERPLAKLGPHRLQHGDLLRLGDYQLLVALEAARPAAAAPVPQVSPDPVPTSIEVLHSVGRAAQTDIGASLNLDELLMTESPSGTRLRPVDAYGQAVPLPSSPAPSPPRTREADDDDALVARRIERLARAAAKSRERASLPALYDAQSGLAAFCRGAGIDPDQLPPDSQTRLLHLAGQLLREALVGFKDLERTRHGLRNRLRIETETDPDDPRPNLELTAVDELLVQLLAQHESRRIDAVQWLRDAVEHSKRHEQGMAEAMRAAFVDFVSRFDPAELEARFQRATRRGKSDSPEAQYWTLFRDFYRNLTEMPADQLPHTFVEAFAEAYRRICFAARDTVD